MSPWAGETELGPAIDGERQRWRPAGGGLGTVSLYVTQRNHARPVVLVHDLRATSSAYEMRPLFECFRWGRPTYAFDFPGFGLSDRPELLYTPGLLAAVLAELLRKVRRPDTPADVVALGRGAEIAARVARDDPALIRSLVMLEPSGMLPMHGVTLETLAARVADLLGEQAARTLFSVIATRPIVRHATRVRFCGPVDEGLVAYAHATAQMPGAHRAPLATLSHGPSGPEAAMLYRAVTVPVLVIHDASGIGAVELEAFLRGRANRFAVRVSPTRGMPHFERRGETVAALDRFWHSLQRAACDRATR